MPVAETAAVTDIRQILGDFTALAFLGTAFIMVIRWLVIRMTDDIKNNTKSLKGLQLAQLELFKALMLHDARVRGVNPTAGKDAEEAHQIAAEEYRVVQASLTHLQEMIKRSMAEDAPARRSLL